MKVYDKSGNLIRDLVPCERNSDKVIGLYDLVNNMFYENVGDNTVPFSGTERSQQIYFHKTGIQANQIIEI